MANPLPPNVIYCPLCRDGGGIARHCYQADVTVTGVQLHAYCCDGCDKWLIVRWTPQRPDKWIVAHVLREKPRQVRIGERIVDGDSLRN